MKKLWLANFSIAKDSFLNILDGVSSFVNKKVIASALWQQ
jgi:hypothetical protein